MLSARVVLMAKYSRIVGVDGILSTYEAIMAEYGEDCKKVITECAKEVGKEAADRLKQTSPSRSGAYAKSWAMSVLPQAKSKVHVVVHNMDRYRLTHLLENGHVSRNGTGRTFGFVEARPHIAPVEDWAAEKMPELVKERLGR